MLDDETGIDRVPIGIAPPHHSDVNDRNAGLFRTYHRGGGPLDNIAHREAREGVARVYPFGMAVVVLEVNDYQGGLACFGTI
jgi:hypothetical protein